MGRRPRPKKRWPKNERKVSGVELFIVEWMTRRVERVGSVIRRGLVTVG